MEKWKIKIEGETPVLWNRLKKEIRDKIKELKKDELEQNELDNWMIKAETNNGNVIIPTEWIIGCLVNSAKEQRIVPYFATSKNQTWTKYLSNLRIMGSPIVAGKSKDLYREEHMLSSQGKSNRGGKVLRCHPSLKKWSAEFEMIDTLGRLREQDLKELLSYGGLAVGIGDLRIFNYGRFTVTQLKKVT